MYRITTAVRITSTDYSQLAVFKKVLVTVPYIKTDK